MQLERNLTRLQSRVFVYSSSKADRAFFSSKIHEWLLTPAVDRTPFVTFMKDLALKRNADGGRLKYMYHNEATQKAEPLIDFIKWGEAARDEIYKQLKNYYA